MATRERLKKVQTAEKTIELLELIAAGNSRLGIGEISKLLGVSRRDALLLLVTLENLGMICWNAEKRIYCTAARAESLCHAKSRILSGNRDEEGGSLQVREMMQRTPMLACAM